MGIFKKQPVIRVAVVILYQSSQGHTSKYEENVPGPRSPAPGRLMTALIQFDGCVSLNRFWFTDDLAWQVALSKANVFSIHIKPGTETKHNFKSTLYTRALTFED